MSGFLLDVNVLIGLIRQDHASHKVVKRWFRHIGDKHWATCSFTQTSFIRIVSNPKFSQDPLDLTEALEMLATLLKLPGHRFWTSDVGFLESVQPFKERLFGHQQVSDAYLLGLAVVKRGKLVTLDRGISTLAGTELSDHITLLE